MPQKTYHDLTGIALAPDQSRITSHIFYSRGSTIPLCDWYFPFLSL